jgi:phosphohistidine phosphatase
MRQLLLLRHAKAVPEGDRAAPEGADHARPLDAPGIAAAVAMGRAIRTLGLAPDMVLVSPARRTMQTLDALEPWDEMPLVEPIGGLYLATAPQILAILHGVSETVRSLMVIGHNPGLHDLALLLADGRGAAFPRLKAGFPTCALAEFTLAAHWSGLAEGGGRLERFLSPADLPEPAR